MEYEAKQKLVEEGKLDEDLVPPIAGCVISLTGSSTKDLAMEGRWYVPVDREPIQCEKSILLAWARGTDRSMVQQGKCKWQGKEVGKWKLTVQFLSYADKSLTTELMAGFGEVTPQHVEELKAWVAKVKSKAEAKPKAKPKGKSNRKKSGSSKDEKVEEKEERRAEEEEQEAHAEREEEEETHAEEEEDEHEYEAKQVRREAEDAEEEEEEEQEEEEEKETRRPTRSNVTSSSSSTRRSNRSRSPAARGHETSTTRKGTKSRGH